MKGLRCQCRGGGFSPAGESPSWTAAVPLSDVFRRTAAARHASQLPSVASRRRRRLAARQPPSGETTCQDCCLSDLHPSLISTARSTRVMPASILPRFVDNRHRYCGRWLYGRLFVKCISLSLRGGVGRENDSFSRRQQFNMLGYFVFPRFP